MSLEGPVPDSTVHGLDWPKQMPGGGEGGRYTILCKKRTKSTLCKKRVNMTFLGKQTCVTVSPRYYLGSTLGSKMQVTNTCEIWHFSMLTCFCLVSITFLCRKKYLLLVTPVNVGPTTARQATSVAQNHCRVWLVSLCTIQKSHIVTRKVGLPFWADCALLVSYGLKLGCSLRKRDLPP